MEELVVNAAVIVGLTATVVLLTRAKVRFTFTPLQVISSTLWVAAAVVMHWIGSPVSSLGFHLLAGVIVAVAFTMGPVCLLAVPRRISALALVWAGMICAGGGLIGLGAYWQYVGWAFVVSGTISVVEALSPSDATVQA